MLLIKIVELIDLTTEVIAECFKSSLTILAQQSNDVSSVSFCWTNFITRLPGIVTSNHGSNFRQNIAGIAQLPSENRVGMLLAKFSLNSATRTSETLLQP